MAPEPTWGIIFCVVSMKVNAAQQNKSLLLHNSFFNLLVLFCKSVFVALTRNVEHHIENTKKSHEVWKQKWMKTRNKCSINRQKLAPTTGCLCLQRSIYTSFNTKPVTFSQASHMVQCFDTVGWWQTGRPSCCRNEDLRQLSQRFCSESDKQSRRGRWLGKLHWKPATKRRAVGGDGSSQQLTSTANKHNIIINYNTVSSSTAVHYDCDNQVRYMAAFQTAADTDAPLAGKRVDHGGAADDDGWLAAGELVRYVWVWVTAPLLLEARDALYGGPVAGNLPTRHTRWTERYFSYCFQQWKYG